MSSTGTNENFLTRGPLLVLACASNALYATTLFFWIHAVLDPYYIHVYKRSILL